MEEACIKTINCVEIPKTLEDPPAPENDELDDDDFGDDPNVTAYDMTSERLVEVLDDMNLKLKKKLAQTVAGIDWSAIM